MNLWAAFWRSCNQIDGRDEHIIFERGLPALFRTRAECREWIKIRYGYIKYRKDLRKEPHGWRLPEARKVEIQVKNPAPERERGLGG